MKLTGKQGQILMLLAAGGLLLWYTKNKVVETVKTVGNAVNPVNPDNVFNQGVNKIGQEISGDKDFSLGVWIYDITHDDETF